MPTPNLRLLCLSALIPLLFAACREKLPQPPPLPTPTAQQTAAKRAAAVPEETRKHWTYLNRIRQRDEFSGAIARTLVTDQNELSVVLHARIVPEQVPPLMQKVMGEMSQEFPQQNLTIAAFKEGSPPQRLGTAHLDGKSGDASFKPQ